MPRPPIEWHFPLSNTTRTFTDDSPRDHSSSVASKTVGWKTGVCKNCHLVVLKVEDETYDDTIWALQEALNDVIRKGRQNKAVVLYPMYLADIHEAWGGIPEEYLIQQVTTMGSVRRS